MENNTAPQTRHDEPSLERPEVYAFLDYRAFLRTYYQYRKATSRSFSFRAFARLIGVPGHGHVKMVMDGQRNLSSKLARKVARACDLSKDESGYFVGLVRWNQSQDLDERQALWRDLLAQRVESNFHELTGDEMYLLSDWWNVAVFETLRLGDFREDAEWISRRLRGSISPERVKEILRGLVHAGLLEHGSEGLSVSKKTLVKGGDVPNAIIQLFHHQVATLAIQALAQTSVQRREYVSTTVTIRRDQLTEMKAAIRKFQQTLLQATEDIHEGDEIYQLNIQFFPITEED